MCISLSLKSQKGSNRDQPQLTTRFNAMLSVFIFQLSCAPWQQRRQILSFHKRFLTQKMWTAINRDEPRGLEFFNSSLECYSSYILSITSHSAKYISFSFKHSKNLDFSLDRHFFKNRYKKLRNWYRNSASAERLTSVHFISLCENWRWNFKFTIIFDLFSSRKEGNFSSSRLSRTPKKYELENFHYFFSLTTSNRHLCCIN